MKSLSNQSRLCIAVDALRVACVGSAATLVLSLSAYAQSTTNTTLDGIRVEPKVYSQDYGLELFGNRFDLNYAKPDGLQALIRYSTDQIKKSEEQEAEAERVKAEGGEYSEPEDLVSKKMKRGYEEIINLAVVALSADTSPKDKADAVVHIRESARSIVKNTERPMPKSVGIGKALKMKKKALSESVGNGSKENPALNLDIPDGSTPSDLDLSRVDPIASTFWTKPKNIGAQDLYVGYGRSSIPSFSDVECVYDAPKTNYGTHPGFEMKCGKLKVKLKVEKRQTEVFSSRVLHALGYNVSPNDPAFGVKVKYDRRILTEWNMRKDITTKIKALFGLVKVHEIKFQQYEDPFAYPGLAGAILTDGSRISSADLKKMIFKDPNIEKPETDPSNYNTEFESRVATLVYDGVNLQIDPKNEKSLGPWDFDTLDHPNRRELRGLGLIAAWMSWFDVRWDNMRLKVVEKNGIKQLVHVLSDTGGVLDANEVQQSRLKKQNRDSFPWAFTLGEEEKEVQKKKRRFAIRSEYQPYEPVAAFDAMNYDDARWAGRMIAQLTEQQMIDAFMVGPRWSSAAIKLLVEKLITRRDTMVRHLGLKDEFPLLRPERATMSEEEIAASINYDPERDGRISIVREGKTIVAPDSDFDDGTIEVIKGGVLTKRTK